MIKGLTYDLQFFTSSSWRLATNRFFGNSDGRLKGCDITTGFNNVLISAGYLVVNGGLIQLTSQEVISAGTSGTKTLCFQIDLSQTNTNDNFNQGSFILTTTTPVKQDLWAGGTIYQCPIATITTNGTSITSSTVLLKEIDGDLIGLIQTLQSEIADLETLVNAKPNTYSGTTDPASSLGKNGDIYIKVE